MSSCRLHLRLLPIALCAIAVTTAIPVELRAPSWDYLHEPADGLDLILNMLLYLPLGAALYRKGWVRIASIALPTSALIELLQIIAVERFPSLWDVAANVAGALLGALLMSHFHRGDEVEIRFSGRSTIGLGALFVVFVFLMSLPGRSTSLDGWDPTAVLMVGNEVTGNRPWKGEVMSVGVSSELFASKRIRHLHRLGPDKFPRREIDWSCCDADAADTSQPSGIPHAEPLLAESERRPFFDSLAGGNALTILAWFRTDNLSQTGPARILTYSLDPWRRNFTLAQKENRLVFRLRTPVTGPNGMRPYVQTSNVLLGGDRPTFAAATYDGQVARIYIDGRYTGRANFQAHDRVFPHLADSGLPASTAFCSVSLVIIGLAIFKPNRRNHGLAIGVMGGAAGAAVLIWTGGATALPQFASWSFLVGAACGIGVSCARSENQSSRLLEP